MKRFIIFASLICLMGGVGFVAGQFFKPDQENATDLGKQRELLFKLPLGQFTMQIVKPSLFLNVVFDMDVYIAGAGNFEEMNGGLSRNEMRDEVIRLLSNMVETSLWVDEENVKDVTPEQLESRIIQKLTHSYPMVRSIEISDLVSSRKDR